jgi:5-methylthioadenosine/S-adenosylhomocysteine deaminase
VAYLDAAGVLGANTLAIHLVQVDDEDIARLAARRTAVAHCPLSNRRHAHGTAPLRAMRAAGLCVGLGTDSVASVGRLDLLAEARAARVLAALDAEEAVALCTVDAAAAIGLVGAVGVLAEGAWGDIVAIRLRDAAPADLYEAVLGSGPRDVRATWIGGREVFRAAAGPLSLHGDPLPAGA